MVSRRGESRLGCLIVLLILAVAAYFAVDFGEAYFRFYQPRRTTRSPNACHHSLTASSCHLAPS